MSQPGQVLENIWQAFSGEAAWQSVADLSRYHRIQASPGFRQATHYLQRHLVDAGLAAEILSYPADEATHFWAWPSFQEWDCREASLDLVQPHEERSRLADFRASPISLIQRSAPFEGELKVVVVEDGEEEEDYEGLDVSGMAVLSRGDLRRVWELAVEKRGAAGILFDGMRPVPPVRLAGDLQDTRQYTSFWWEPADVKCFGFVLTPRQGQALRRLLGKPATPVRVSAKVVSRFYDGELEVLSALIPGGEGGAAEGVEEVLVVAHLCHPLPSANDNASGAAAGLEAARTLHTLISGGVLPSPKRAIRFLWLPEMTGTYAYLSRRTEDLSRCIAGINLDMVGEDQDQTGSSWLIERPPDAVASFAPDLLAWLRDEFPSLRNMVDVSASHGGQVGHPLYRQAETAFTGGSDHIILSDPTVGIPTPMLIQWPDRYYHTSADTPDRTDPRSLARSGTLAAAYAYWLASAGPEEATALAYEMLARFKARIVRIARKTCREILDAAGGAGVAGAMAALDRRLAYVLDRQKAALQSLQRLAPVECLGVDLANEAEGAVQRELNWAAGAAGLQTATLGLATLPEPLPHSLSETEREASERVPVRLVPGPVMLQSHLRRLSRPDREAWRLLLKDRKGREHHTLTLLALNWADGARSLLQIAELVELEAGLIDLELLSAYFHLLEKLGFVAFQ